MAVCQVSLFGCPSERQERPPLTGRTVPDQHIGVWTKKWFRSLIRRAQQISKFLKQVSVGTSFNSKVISINHLETPLCFRTGLVNDLKSSKTEIRHSKRRIQNEPARFACELRINASRNAGNVEICKESALHCTRFERIRTSGHFNLT